MDKILSDENKTTDRFGQPISTDDDEYQDVLGSGAIMKKIITTGPKLITPKRGDEVTVDAVGYLNQNLEIDRFDTMTFTLGGGEVIPGFDIVVALMCLDEECEVTFDARFAYGSVGLCPGIPPNSKMLYRIKLTNVTAEESPEELDIEERKAIGLRKRERGNFWFNRDEFSQAIMCYKGAIDFLDDTSHPHVETTREVKEILEVRLVTLNNLAASQIKIGADDAALISLDPILKCQPRNVKALYRKGKVLTRQKKYKESLETFNLALTIEPESKVIVAEMYKLKDILRKEAESERTLYRNMFGIFKSAPAEPERYPSLRRKHLKTIVIAFLVLAAAGITLRAILKMQTL